MALAPLAPLRALRALSLELGVADLAALPPGITSLTLMDVDRIGKRSGTIKWLSAGTTVGYCSQTHMHCSFL